MVKLGSLFDGSGGFPLAGAMHGIEPVWAAEVEPFPIKVTRERFPNMRHYGDVSKMNGADVEPVDVITFGSPCQDLSVAGKRAGMHDGERSNLFFQAVRIIKEMRCATNGKYPRFAVWENVPGAFSSNRGNDFLAVLKALAEAEGGSQDDVPEPERKNDRLVWAKSGCIVGDGFSIAWRTLDAQYWGVPQRRARIYLVADFTGERAPEILFKPDSVRVYSASCGEARENSPGDVAGSTDGNMRCLNPWDSQSKLSMQDVCNTLDCMHDQQEVLYDMTHANDVVREYVDCSPTLQHRMGTGGNQVPIKVDSENRKYIVRRLTPLECCRLQGFPDGWDEIPDKQQFTDEEAEFWNGVRSTYARINGNAYKPAKRGSILRWYNKLGADSARYKMWGNGIALPCAEFVLGRIAEHEK